MEMAPLGAPTPMPAAAGDPSWFAPRPPSYEASEARHGAAERNNRIRPEKMAAKATKAAKPPRETKAAPPAARKPTERTAKEAGRRPK